MKTFGEVRHSMLKWAASAVQPPEEHSTQRVALGFSRFASQEEKNDPNTLTGVAFRKDGVVVVSWGSGACTKETGDHAEVCRNALAWVQKAPNRPPVESSCECGVRWECTSVEFSAEGTEMKFRCPTCGETTGATMWSAEGACPVVLHISSPGFFADEKSRLMPRDPDEIVIKFFE